MTQTPRFALLLAASAVALGVGLVAPGLAGALGLFAVAGILPGLAAAEWLLPAASSWTRAVVGLSLGPLVATVIAIGPFAAGVAPRLLVLALGIGSLAALILAGRRRRHARPGAGLPGIDAPLSRAVLAFALAMAVLIAIPALTHEWSRVKGDAWIHAGIVHQILGRGVPPEDPRWAGQILNYVWFFNFFVALLSGARGGDPFTFMVLLNLLDLVAFLGLAHLAAWTIWRDPRIATHATVLMAFGLNAGAWLLWPLRGLLGLTGSVRGADAVIAALRPPDLTSWRVVYELSAPFAHMVSFLDKFMIGTALNYAWVQMLLVLWALLAWLSGGPRALLVLVAAGAAGMLLFHGVVGLSVIPVLGLACGLALVLRHRVPSLPPAGRLAPAGLALVAGGLAALPYTRAISRGWDAGQTGMAHSYVVPSPAMAWTVLTSCGIVLALAWQPARRLVRAGHGPGILLVLFTALMAGFAVFVNLPEDNESKFAFQVFFPAVLLAAAALEPWMSRLRRRLGSNASAVVLLALFALPAGLTLIGLTVDVAQRTSPQVNVPAAERRFHAWLAQGTPANAVVVDNKFRDLAMVLAGRQLYCGSPLGPSRAGFPAAEAQLRHAVMADLYGPAADLAGDAAQLSRLGRPVYLVYREADFPRPADARVLDRAPELFQPVHDAEGFVVYSLFPTSPPGGAR